MTKKLNDCFLFLLLIAGFIGLVFTSSTHAQDKQLKKLSGNWDLSKINDSNVKRAISFTITTEQTTGVFTDSNGQNKTITNIKFSNGAYSFRVPDLGLVFKSIKFSGKNLEGNMIDSNMIDNSSEKPRLVPQAVRLVKK